MTDDPVACPCEWCREVQSVAIALARRISTHAKPLLCAEKHRRRVHGDPIKAAEAEQKVLAALKQKADAFVGRWAGAARER